MLSLAISGGLRGAYLQGGQGLDLSSHGGRLNFSIVIMFLASKEVKPKECYA